MTYGTPHGFIAVGVVLRVLKDYFEFSEGNRPSNQQEEQ